MVDITSLQNPQIKQAIKLRTRRERETTKLFLIEGYRELLRALEGGQEIVTLFYSPDFFLGENEHSLIEEIKKRGSRVFLCAKNVFAKLSYRDRPDGLVAIARQIDRDLQELEKHLSSDPFLLIAEGVEKPGNLGTILRSCDAAGVEGLIVCDPCTDVYNPNVVRASIGTLFTVPHYTAKSEEVISFLRKKGISIVASSPDAKEEFTRVSLQGAVAIVVGTEQYGLSEKWLNQADISVKIPMYGKCDSLNVATATTLLLYEVKRQRNS